MTWSDAAIAGAFVLGLLAGGIGAIRVFKYTLDYMASKHEPPERDGG